MTLTNTNAVFETAIAPPRESLQKGLSKGLAKLQIWGVTAFFILTAIYVTELRWVPYDNQYFVSIFGHSPYPEPILPGRLRFVLFAGLFLVPNAFWPSLRVIGFAGLFFIFYAGMSVLWSVNKTVSISATVELAMLFGWMAIATNLLGTAKVLRIIWYLGVVVVLVSTVLALQGTPQVLMKGLHDGLWRGFFNHKNVYAPMLSSFIVLSLFGNYILKINWFIMLPVVLVAVFSLLKAGSTTAILITFSGILIACAGRIKIGATIRVLILLYLLVVMTALASGWVALLEIGAQSLGKNLTLTGRTNLWDTGILVASERFWGYGFGTSGGQLTIDTLRQLSGWSGARSVHNVYINLWIDCGFIYAAFFFLWLGSKVLVATPLNQRLLYALQAGLATVLFCGGITEVMGGLYGSYQLLALLAVTLSIRAFNFSNT